MVLNFFLYPMMFFDVVNSFLYEVDDLFGEAEGMVEIIFKVAGAFHLFKETTDLFFNLGEMNNLLNKTSNSLMGLCFNMM